MNIQPDSMIMIFLIVGAIVAIYGLMKDKVFWFICGLVVFIIGLIMFYLYMFKY